MPASKLISLPEAVRRFSWDGMQYASGAALPVGSDAVIFGRELLRQGRKDLHALFHCNTQQLNLLAAAGSVRKVAASLALKFTVWLTALGVPSNAAASFWKTIP